MAGTLPMRLVARARSAQASACSALSPLNQFDFVPVWIRDKGNHGSAALTGACLARDVAASGLDLSQAAYASGTPSAI